ncbi:diguanylate cyclase [Anaerocolumna aminovalerica]|jgi:diguanylate cyclase|uniref:GGDEF domain-containing protein n=1 Tax=Anaerocolumna aminovalerica TaxID=1527 RepID=UPI001C0EA6A1|nr:diguanylate cyclase [Anaerocolumna aminovalerica]MBU5333850.1 diguanylate cyclase [Anaerocolumna aminovalerica]
MLNSLFVNASILISFLYLGSQLFRNKKINSKSNLKTKISVGVLFGLTGWVLMFNGIDLSNNMIMDFRIIALIISFIFCGPLSALITVLIIISFRFGYFGICDASITAMYNLIIVFLLSSAISTFILDFKKKYIAMGVVNILSTTIWTFILVKDTKLLLSILHNYIFSTIIVSIIIYFVLVYIYNTNELYLRLKQESETDFLTGLYNVREFEKLLNKFLADAAAKSEELSLLMIDLDYFKNVNDTFGHPSGDMVLKQFSHILTSSCRSFDIISRKGGEEFAIILLGCNYEHAFEIAERIRKNVRQHQFSIDKGKIISITVSIGVSSYSDRINTPEDLLQEADQALYSAKRDGRNIVR